MCFLSILRWKRRVVIVILLIDGRCYDGNHRSGYVIEKDIEINNELDRIDAEIEDWIERMEKLREEEYE